MSGVPQGFQVATTLAARRIVAVNSASADMVKYPASTLELPFGITKDTVKDTTGSIPVAGPGEKAEVYCNDTLTAGSLVSADSSGRAVPFVDATAGVAYIGVNLSGAVSSTGTIAQIYIMPGYKSIP